ncbi:hypothetical protein TDB9533_01784 [Thalassocella blandensis]|nr:hypothetical protein TDB9533_01784 [Thalassocella blandensis]
MRLLPLICVLSFTSLTACTFSNKQEQSEVVVNPSLELLQTQQQQLQEHADRLESLASTQDEMLRYLNNVQVEIAGISKAMEKREQVAIEMAKVKPAVEEKIHRQAREKTVAQGKAILGRVEYIWIEEVKTYLKSRIDTGAKSSSLHAQNIQRFERNGESWVRFALMMDEELINMEAPLERTVKIRQAGVEGLEKRPVVKLNVQLGELKEETEFTLTDRSDMLYPILLGRSFLRDIALVDVARKFTRKRDPKLKALAEVEAE